MAQVAEPTAPAPAADAMCPLRPGDGCKLCVPGASGPGNCGLVYLVLCDPELRAGLDRIWSVTTG